MIAMPVKTATADAQQDYKGEPDNNTAQTVYDKLIKELEWTPE